MTTTVQFQVIYEHPLQDTHRHAVETAKNHLNVCHLLVKLISYKHKTSPLPLKAISFSWLKLSFCARVNAGITCHDDPQSEEHGEKHRDRVCVVCE